MISTDIIEKLSVITPEEEEILSGNANINNSIYSSLDDDVINFKKLMADGRNISFRPHTRFAFFPEHTHDYIEMVYMCKGTTNHIVNGNKICLKTGELLILGRKARQSIEACEKDDIAVNFIIRPEFLSGVLKYLDDEETPLKRFIVDCLCDGEGETYLYFKVADILPVQNLIENLIWEMTNEIPNRRDVYQMTIGILFSELLDYADRIETHSTDQETIVKVLRYIENNYKDATLTEISNELHYEMTALSRFIKKKTGKTFKELLQERRMSQTVWMLKNTDRNVDDIAFSVGYENLSYFHRIFFSRFGMTPKKYRDCK